jgi:hypothetical protein
MKDLVLRTFLGTVRMIGLQFFVSEMVNQMILSLELNILPSFGYKYIRCTNDL